jgi:hypothetical protein
MSMGRALPLSAILLAMAPAAGFAAGCPQEKAIYGDRDGAYELRFEPVGSPSAVTSNHFKVAVLKTDLVLDGIVMQSGEPARPNGMIMNNCPKGDVTGAEIEACTVWQGVIYAASADGAIEALPGEGSEAARRLLLPDFGPAVRNSSIWGKATVAPWDVLTFKECAQ